MPGLLGLYGLAGRSLVSLQTAMNAVSHNVANAATEGFHRQRVEMASGLPQVYAFGALGTGVTVGSVRRVEDRFLEAALQRESPLLARYQARSEVLARTETAFGEPSEGGLSTMLDDFWDGWDELATSPEDLGARESVVRLGAALAGAIGAAYTRIDEEQRSLTGDIARSVDDANRLIREMDSLNQAIVASSRQGVPAADLEDRRDLVSRQLAELVGTTASVETDGTATVRLGGRVLVQKAGADPLVFDTAGAKAVMLQGTVIDAADLGGRLGGLVEARDHDLESAKRRLDELAVRLAADVNGVHAKGRDRRGDAAPDFFVIGHTAPDGVTGAAAGLAVNGALLQDAARVAAGSSGNPGDNGVALDLAALRDDGDGAGAKLRGLVADVGSRARESADLATGQAVVVDSFWAQRESVSGVSLDEEAANLLRFQRAYQAAARIVTTIDEMAQSLLTM